MTEERNLPIETLAGLIETYSKDYDMTEAVINAHNELVAAVVERKGKFTPVELKAIIEQGIQSRLELVIGMVVSVLQRIEGWSVEEADQERKSLTDGLTLVKHHVERMVVVSLIDEDARLDSEEDDDE